jgi:hypothetical protein
MVCLRNICINTLHKGDDDDDDIIVIVIIIIIIIIINVKGKVHPRTGH